MIVREFAVLLGMDLDSGSFAAADHALNVVQKGLQGLEVLARAAASVLDELVFSTARTAAELERTAAQTGINTTELQRLQFAAEQSGVGVDEMRKALIHLARSAEEANLGSAGASKVFAQLGVQATDGRGKVKPMAELLGDVADRFAAIEDPAKKADLATHLFSKAGAALIPFLNQGRDGIAALGDEAERLGAVLSESAVAQGVALTHSTDRLGAAVMGLKYAIGGPLLTAVMQAVDAMTAWLRVNREWIASGVLEAVHGLVAGVGALGRAFGVVYRLVKPWLAVLDGSAKNAGILRVGLGLLATILTVAVGGAVRGVAWEFLAMGAASLWAGAEAAAAAVLAVAPWALLGLGIALAAEDLYVFVTGGKSLIGDFIVAQNKLYAGWLQKRDPNEFFLIRWLKDALVILGDVQGAWMRLRSALGPVGTAFFNNVIGGVSGINPQLLQSFENRVLTPDGNDEASPAGNSRYTPDGRRLKSGVPEYLLPTPANLFGEGAASPSASAAISNRSSSVVNNISPTITANVSIQGGTNVSGDELARQFSDQMRDIILGEHLRPAYEAGQE
jgi:hypothetical protein